MAEPSRKKTIWRQLLGIERSLVDIVHTVEERVSLSHADASVEPDPEMPLLLPEPAQHGEAAQLLTQHIPGWHTPQPSHLPAPTYAPAMTAFGLVFIALGAVTMWPLSIIGAVIFVLAIAKWIGELLA